MNKDALSFPVYWVLSAAEVVIFVAAVWLVSREEGKREARAAWWVVFFGLILYLLSYYGKYGAHPDNPPIPFPWDNVIAAAIGLISFYWAVASGYRTEEMREIAETGTGLVPEEEEEISGLASG